MKNKLTVALVTLAAGASMTARADDSSGPPPANTIRLGMYALFYHVKAEDFSGPYTPAGLNIDLKNTQTLYGGYFRRITSWLDVEFAFGIPPDTKTVGRGPAAVGSVPYNGQEIAKAKWLAPNVVLEYKFLDESSVLRPYVGVGVNYTTFYDRVVTGAGQAATGGPTRLSLSSSVGPIGTVGLKYQPARHWSLALSYSISSVDSNLKTETAGVVRTSRVHFGPQALVVAGGYSF